MKPRIKRITRIMKDCEKECLYKILFEMRAEIHDLKGKVGQLEKRLDDMESARTPMPAPPPYMPLNPIMACVEAEEYVEPDSDSDHLDVHEWSKQALQKVLDRNYGNRKKAAQELGISDRTLYRRLKQYGLA